MKSEEISNGEKPAFTKLTDLAAERLGGKTLACSDDFFAEKENLLKPGRGIFIADKYTERGKWMDGWESRRKRVPGNDWCIIKLATTGVIKGVNIDTNHFLGNHPPHASLEGALLNAKEESSADSFENIKWEELLPKSSLRPGSENFFEISSTKIFSHLRLNIFPDGGVARLNVFGEVFRDWSATSSTETIDLAAAVNGGKAVLCNDMFFSHMGNLIMPGRGVNMGDGWETKRNRTPGNRDWVIVKLAHKGTVKSVVVDTHHFKGNYPDSFILEGCVTDADEKGLHDNYMTWLPIISQTKLSADAEHEFKKVENNGPFTHVRLSIFPDGGVSRLRVFGNLSR